MNRGDAIQSVTHVADVDCYPCSGLNMGALLLDAHAMRVIRLAYTC